MPQDHPARWGISVDIDLLNASTQKRAASTMLDLEPDILLDARIGLVAAANLLMQMETADSSAAYPGFFVQPDDPRVFVDLLAEVEGNPHNSIVFAYLQDAGSSRPARLLQQSIEGKPGSSERIFWFVALDNAYTIYAGYGETDTPATADATFLLKKKSEGVTTTVATMKFKAGETAPVITIMDSVVEVGDRLSFHAPALQDASLANMLVAFVLIFPQS